MPAETHSSMIKQDSSSTEPEKSPEEGIQRGEGGRGESGSQAKNGNDTCSESGSSDVENPGSASSSSSSGVQPGGEDSAPGKKKTADSKKARKSQAESGSKSEQRPEERPSSEREVTSPPPGPASASASAASVLLSNGSPLVGLTASQPLVIPQYLHYIYASQFAIQQQQQQNLANAIDLSGGRMADGTDESQGSGVGGREGKGHRGSSEAVGDGGSDEDSLEYEDAMSFTDDDLEDMMKRRNDGRIRHSG